MPTLWQRVRSHACSSVWPCVCQQVSNFSWDCMTAMLLANCSWIALLTPVTLVLWRAPSDLCHITAQAQVKGSSLFFLQRLHVFWVGSDLANSMIRSPGSFCHDCSHPQHSENGATSLDSRLTSPKECIEETVLRVRVRLQAKSSDGQGYCNYSILVER